jgi:beta-lactamase class A
VAVLLTALSAHAAAQVTSQPLRQQFVDRLEGIASDLDGVMGYAIVDLATADRFERHATQPFPTASTIKLAILYELFRQADAGRIALDTPQPFDREKAVGGSGVLFELSNVTMTLRDYATLMVVLSDNSATNMVIDAVEMDRVNARMKELGLADVQLRRKMMDLDAALRGRENVASPAGIARLLELMRAGQGLSAASRDAMMGVLQKGKSSAMLRGIPSGVSVASKPGDLDGVRVDAGIVEVPGRPYIFVAMTSWLGPREDGERAIEEASRAAYEYFSRLATSSEYGRVVR